MTETTHQASTVRPGDGVAVRRADGALGVLDRDGNLVVTDRIKNLIHDWAWLSPGTRSGVDTLIGIGRQ